MPRSSGPEATGRRRAPGGARPRSLRAVTPGEHTVGMPSLETAPLPSGTLWAPDGTGSARAAVTPDHWSRRTDQARRRPASWAPSWHPLAGPALLDRLRSTGRARPSGDPTLATELRTFLQE